MACAVPPHPFASASRKAIAASRATFTERASLLPPAAVGSRPAVADRLKLAGGRGMLAKAARCCSSPKEPVGAHPPRQKSDEHDRSPLRRAQWIPSMTSEVSCQSFEVNFLTTIGNCDSMYRLEGGVA